MLVEEQKLEDELIAIILKQKNKRDASKMIDLANVHPSIPTSIKKNKKKRNKIK